MMIRRTPATLMTLVAGAVLALALVAAPANPARADRDDHDRARAALQAGEVRPLRDVLAVAAAQFEGDMVEAELDRKGPFWIYEITLVTDDGSILKLYYDAATIDLVRVRGRDAQRWFKGAPADFPDLAAARSAMHERMHEQWHQRWHEDGGPKGWFRQWWRGEDGEEKGEGD